MSRVNMTITLRDQILESVLTPLRKRSKELREQLRNNHAEDFIEAALTPEQAAARRTLMNVPGMMTSQTRFAFKVKVDEQMLLVDLTPDGYAAQYIKGVPEFLSPYISTGQKYSEQLEAVEELDGPLIDKHMDTFRELLKNRNRRRTLKGEITSLLAKAITLQDVFKVWPSVLDHVPKEVQDRFHRKVARSKSEPKPELALSGDAAIELSKLRLGAV